MRCHVETTEFGRAIITAEGNTYTYDKAEGVRAVGGTNLGMWMQQPAQVHAWTEDDEHPFAKITAKVDLLESTRAALMAFLGSLDTDYLPETRMKLAAHAQELCTRREVLEKLEEILLRTPLPDIADLTHGPAEGPAGDLLKKIIAKWRT